MRIVFCGSGPFAVPVLRAILSAGHDVAAVITQPARPAGRGGTVRSTPAGRAAEDAGLPVTEWPNINAEEAIRSLRAAKPEVLCVADFGQLIRAAARQVAPLGAFNLHASLLPALRGAAPVQWAIIRGRQRTGVTTFSLVDAMDAGAIYLQAATDIRPQETADELTGRLAEMGAELVCRTLDLLASGGAQPSPQDESNATTAPRLKKADGIIRWDADAAAIRNLIHGTWPWPGAQCRFRQAGSRDVDVAIARAVVEPGRAAGEPGTIGKDHCVATGSGRLRILELRPAGRRRMTWRDFVNGYRAAPGDRFVSIGA